ncbi:MAG: DUF5611 family protein [Methermicoccaceae archaeon]
MQYKFKRGYSPDINRVLEVLKESFGVGPVPVEGAYMLSYGALKELRVWIEDKKLGVSTISKPEATDEEILDTNNRFRNFLTLATGYSTKERVKMAKKEAEGGGK